MINGDVNKFVDRISYGEELIFLYGGKKFFLQGYPWKGKYTLFLEQWEPPGDACIWEGVGDDKHFPVNDFLKAKLWDGRTFWEAEAEMEWTD